MSEDFKLMPMMQPNKLFITENRDHTLYEYYLVGAIGDPDEYIDLCNALRAARPEDRFVLRFNSGGGQVRTGNQILNALHECEATTIGFIEHDCGSMTTFLFLACKTWGVSKYAEWFSHTVSGGNFGKECETFEASQFLRRQTHKRIKEEYAGFLTEEEIEKILTGTDIYLDADEIMDRLESFVEVQEQGCGDGSCTDCNQESMPSIDSIITEAVASGVEQGLAAVLKKYELVERPKKSSRAKNPTTERVDKKLKEDLKTAIEEKKPSTKTKKALDDAKVIKENMESSIPPLTKEEHEAIRKVSPVSDLPAERITRKLK